MKLFASIGLILCAWASSCFAQSVTGTVRYFEPKDTMPPQEVVLKIFDQGVHIASSKTTTDKKGAYSFDVSERTPNWYFQVATTYQEAEFSSDFFMDLTDPVPDLVLSKVTGARDELSIVEVVFFEFGKSSLVKVSHEIQVHNQSNKAYHPDIKDGQPVLIDLIDGGFSLSIVEGASRQDIEVVEADHQMILSTRLLPQEKRSIRFSYMFPLDQRTIDYARTNLEQHKSLSLISNLDRFRIDSDVFSPLDVPASLGTEFTKGYTTTTVPASIDISIKGFVRSKDKLQQISLGISLLLLVLFFIYLLIKPQTRFDRTEAQLIEEIKFLSDQAAQDPTLNSKLAMLKRKLYHLRYG